MTIAGPVVMDCDQRCEVPAGVRIERVPRPRHGWGDVKHCPNEGCGRSFLVLAEGRGAVPPALRATQ